MKFASLVILLFALTLNAEAQNRPAPELRLTTGWAGFIDEDWVDHAAIGASIRYYLTRRVSIEPEFMFLIGPGSDRDITVVPHLSLDFRPEKPVRPYIIGGAGLLHQRVDFPGGRFTHDEWTGSFGAGVKVFLTPRVFVAPEVRVGWEPTMRVTGSIGFVF